MTSAPFALGIASFDPLPDRVLLWTRIDGGGACRWQVATDPGFGDADIAAVGESTADAQTGIVTVDVSGLRPATTYWYRFQRDPTDHVGDATSPTGRTRTLPSNGADRLRIGLACCARYGQARFTTYGALARTDLDLVVHLGDYIYEDDTFDLDDRVPDPAHDCVDLDDYRRRHAQARQDADLQLLHASHPMVVVWDDHDLADNAWSGGAKTHDRDEHGPWAARRDAALRAHQEFLPKRLADASDDSSAWRRLDAGDLVGIVCLETRAHRDQQAGIEGSTPASDPNRTMLGRQQASWMDDAVSDPSLQWVLVVSGTVVSELVIEAPDALDRVLPEKYALVDGRATNTDQWDGYLADRRRLARALARRDGGSLVVSGDIHSAWAIEGPCADDGVPVAVELVCPPAATTPLGELLPPGVGSRLGPALEDQLPRVRWVDVDHRGYLTLDIATDRATAAWWWVKPGSDEPAERGRQWTIHRARPMGLVDPEPSPEPKREPGATGSPLAVRRRRRLLAGLLTAGAVCAAATGIAVVHRRRPRRRTLRRRGR